MKKRKGMIMHALHLHEEETSIVFKDIMMGRITCSGEKVKAGGNQEQLDLYRENG